MIGFRWLLLRDPRRFSLALAVAALGACASPSAGPGGTPGRELEQDIDARRNAGPTSIDPGAPRDARRFLVPSESDGSEERKPPALTGAARATQSQIGSGTLPIGDRQAGRRFALDNCRPCHVVAPDQGSTVRFANAPDFRTIADGRHATPFELSVWLTNPHPTMPTLALSPQEAQDVIAYILSLRDGH